MTVSASLYDTLFRFRGHSSTIGLDRRNDQAVVNVDLHARRLVDASAKQ